MNYKVVRTETADARIRKIILYVAENFGMEVALEKLEELERNLLDLGKYPQKCVELRYLVLKRQGYKVLVLEKNLVFYKINEEKQEAIIYAVVDHRPDYLNIIFYKEKVRNISGSGLEQARFLCQESLPWIRLSVLKNEITLQTSPC